ncbi:MAG: ThuA domain-containing protein [Lentisphaeraceae bacterium]|nr:ThuA domain-containing protein [Lentisphaeraceae bacterium]
MCRYLQIALILLFSCSSYAKIRISIIDGQNNHDWVKTTKNIKASLDETDRFEVNVLTSPKAKTPEFAAWNPSLENTDVILLNYNGHEWSDAFKAKFLSFVKNGGGLILIHAANNAFSNWSEYNDMIGLGWRKEGHGTAVKVDDHSGKCVHQEKGNSGHGSKHPFKVKVRQANHPIMKGIPSEWLHAKDELYHNMRGDFKNCTILSTAFSDSKQRGTGQHEPLTWEVKYGKGKVIVTSMGHIWKNDKAINSVHCVGFQTIVSRSCEYVATGKVTIPVPKNFPTVDKTSLHVPANSQLTWKEKKTANPYCVLSPEESVKAMEIQDGYIVEAVAAAPLVEEPVVVVWDGDGAMYVAEMRSYMQDSKGTGTKTLKNGRIKRLVDIDGDGIMDKATIFADGLNLPRMLLPLDGRLAVIETDSTDIWSYEDTNGDGVSDKKKLLYKGKRTISPTRSVEHQSSGLVWNVDNYIYTTREKYRFRFTNEIWQDDLCSTEDWMQWGLTHDDEGRLFYSANSEPTKGIQQHPSYWLLSKKRAQGKWRKPTIGPDYQPDFMVMHSTCEQGDRGESHSYKSFTSSCGQTIYRGGLFPEDANGDYFISDPTGHVVRRANVSNINGRLELQNPTPNKEFIVSSDINFRPVNSSTGPDGNLYIVDMARGIIQDAPWVNAQAAKFMDKVGLSKNIKNGRIWRIRHKDSKSSSVPKLLSKSTKELIPYLGHSNGWIRDTAQKLIILRKDRNGVLEKLKKLAQTSSKPLARLHTLWTLEGCDSITPEIIATSLKDSDQRVVRAALKISERYLKDDNAYVLNQIGALNLYKDSVTAKQLILSLGYSNDKQAFEIIDKAIESHISNEGIYLAAMTVLYNQKTTLLTKMLDGSAFELIKNPEQRALTRRRWLSGMSSWKSTSAPPANMSKEHLALLTKGEEIYNQMCFTCHGKDGKGLLPAGAEIALAPSLVDSKRVNGLPHALTRILLHGLTGPLDGKHYEAGVMVPAASLGFGSDEQIASVLSYIRSSWGNQGSVIEPQFVKTIRNKSTLRTTPWTQSELIEFAPKALTDRSKWVATSSGGDSNAMNVILDKNKCDNQNKPGSWFAIDLGETQLLSRMILDADNPDRYPRGWSLHISDDGKTWQKDIVVGNGNGSITTIDFSAIKTRHVKIVLTGTSNHHRWGLRRIYIYGK